MHNSVVRLSEIKQGSDFRIDAEYWQPVFIDNSKLVSGNTTIRNFVGLNIGNIKSSPMNRDFDYLEISGIDLSGCEYETTMVKFGKEPGRAHSILEKGDIVVSTVRPNRNAVAFIEEDGIVGSSGLSVLRAGAIEAEYLFIFCKTNYFVKCLMRANTASMYPSVSNNDILEVPLFVPSVSFRTLVVDVIKKSIFDIKRAKHTYAQAQTCFLSEICFAEWHPKHQLTFVKNYSDTEKVGRIDAEYYQPKYEAIIKAIKGCGGGWDVLGNLVEIKKCIEVGRDEYLEEGIPFVRVSNLNPFEITEEKYISESLYQKIKQHQPQKGEILFSKDATPGIAYYLSDEPHKMIPASGVVRLKSRTDRINGEYLTMVLNSVLIKEQINRDVGGSIILHWRPEQVAETAIPILSKDTQAKIQHKIIEAFELRRRSKGLLECAKRAVEMAIEQGEETAREWLEAETDQL